MDYNTPYMIHHPLFAFVGFLIKWRVLCTRYVHYCMFTLWLWYYINLKIYETPYISIIILCMSVEDICKVVQEDHMSYLNTCYRFNAILNIGFPWSSAVLSSEIPYKISYWWKSSISGKESMYIHTVAEWIHHCCRGGID